MNDRTEQLLIVSITITILVIIAMWWRGCDEQRDRRLECVKSGKAVAECSQAFGDTQR